jgi:hypothetical protein
MGLLEKENHMIASDRRVDRCRVQRDFVTCARTQAHRQERLEELTVQILTA